MVGSDHEPGELPSPYPLLDMLFGSVSMPFLKLPILRAGLELRVWESIAAGHHTAAGLAEVLGADETGVRQLLDALTVMKLLEKADADYQLPPLAESYLLPDAQIYLGGFLLEWLAWERHGQLAEAIRSGRRPIVPDVTRPESVEHFLPFYAIRAQDPERQLERYRDYWGTLQVEPRPGLRVLDAACGTGIATLVLAQQDPEIRVTLQDWPAMLTLANEVARTLGVREQVTHLPGDLRAVDFGYDAFDVARLGFVTYFFSRDDLMRLFSTVRAALSHHGLLVIEAPLCDESHCENEEALLDGPWLFAVSAGGDVYTFEDYAELLGLAGFDAVERVDDGLVRARQSQ